MCIFHVHAIIECTPLRHVCMFTLFTNANGVITLYLHENPNNVIHTEFSNVS